MNIKNNDLTLYPKRAFALTLALTLLGANVIAAENKGFLANTEITIANDNNIRKEVNRTSDNYLSVAPNLSISGSYGKQVYSVKYKGLFTAYASNSQLNFNDHDFDVTTQLEHSYKFQTEIKLNYEDKNERPGSTNALLFDDEFNKFNKLGIASKFTYGRSDSTGQLVIGLTYNRNRFTNNNQDFRNVNISKINTQFFYRITSKIRTFVDVSYIDFDYLPVIVDFDQSSSEINILTGIEYEPTDKIKGSFKIGYIDKTYKQTQFNDVDGLAYELDFTYSPNTYSELKLVAVRQTVESADQTIGASLNTQYAIELKHEITPRTDIQARFSLDNDEIVSARVSSFNFNREDDRADLELSLQYSVTEWLNCKLNYRAYERRSTNELFEFDANIIGLSIISKFK